MNDISPWVDSDVKQACRDRIVSVSNQLLPQVGKVFTLPSKEALCAHTFRKAWPSCNIVGVEKIKRVWKQIDKTCNMDVINCSLSDYVKHIPPFMRFHFDVAYFDLVGSASPKNVGDIVSFIANNNVFHKGRASVIAMTFNSRCIHANRDITDKVLDDICDNVWFNNDEYVEYNPETAAALVMGRLSQKIKMIRVLDLHHVEQYQAQESSTPMFFMILHLEKY